MPEYETDRTENSKRKSHETLESSQIQPHQQQHESSSPFSSEDQTSEEHNGYKETGTQTVGIQHVQVEQNLDNERNEEENAADRASEQDKPLTGDQMNALTRDLADHIEGMGNATDRASEQDKPLTGDQINALTRDLADHIEGMGNAKDRASEQDKPLTGDQMNALTRDLAEHIEGMGNERGVDETETTDDLTSASRENNLECTSNESDRCNRGTVNESICEQKNMDTCRDINPDNDKVETNQRYDCKVKITSEHPSVQHDGSNVEENPSVPTTTNKNQIHPNEEMGNKRHSGEDQKADLPVEHQASTKATMGEGQTTTSQINKNIVSDRKCEETEHNNSTVAKPVCEKTVIDKRCPHCNGRQEQSIRQNNEQSCEEHEEAKSVEKPTAPTTTNKNQIQPNEEMGNKRHSDEDQKADLPVEHQTSIKATAGEDQTTSQINKNVAPDRKCEETERNDSTVAKPVCEKTVIDKRCPNCNGRQEQSIHQNNEQSCEEHEEAKSVEKPTAPTTVENKQNAETKIRSENDEQPKADGMTDEQVKESEVHTADGEQDGEKLKKETTGSSDHVDTVLTEHEDRNRTKGALAKTDEALTATVQKLAYETKHLAIRVKDMFTKKRHHEVEIWPDGVIVGKEPENEPEPSEYIKAAHEVVAKFNEHTEESGSDLNVESKELDTHRSAQSDECAEEVCNTKAQEVPADETEGSGKGKCDAEKPSETATESLEIAKTCGNIWKQNAMEKPEETDEKVSKCKKTEQPAESNEKSAHVTVEKSEETDEKVCKCKETGRPAESNEKSAHIAVEKSGETDEKVCKCKKTERTAESNEKSANDATNENREEKSSAATSQSKDGEKVGQTAKNETETQSHVEHDEQADTEKTENDENDDDKSKPTFKLCNPTDIPESERAAWWDNLEKEATKRVNNLSNEAVAHGAKKTDKDGEKGKTKPTEDQENLKNSADKSDESRVANDGQQSTAQKADTSKENMQTTAQDTSASDHPAPNTDKGRKQVESTARQQSAGAVPQLTNATRA